jgi:hypothetical protein
LREILTITLALGNYMNGGTKNGQAWGFKLTTLKQLSSAKSVDSQFSLMHYLVKHIKTKSPKTWKTLEQCAAVHEASRVENAFLQAEIRKLQGMVQRLEVELSKCEESIEDRFAAEMKKFHEYARKRVTSKLEKKLMEAEESYKQALKLFGETNSKLQWEEFFKVFSRFFKGMEAADKQLDQIELNKEKSKRAEEHRKKRKAEMERRKEQEGRSGKKKKKKKDKSKEKNSVLVDRIYQSLKDREDSEYTRMQASGKLKAKKKKKNKDLVGILDTEPKKKKKKDRSNETEEERIARKLKKQMKKSKK